MRQSGTRLGLAVAALAWTGMLILSGTSSATLPMQKKAKELGFPAANCMYCHEEKLPKKGAVTHNARGEWLVGEKEKRHAKEVDVTWLKYYPEDQKDKK